MAVAEDIGRILTERDETLAIAESLTGGLVTSMVTDVPGSSAYLLEGVVAYANESKMERLGVAEATLIAHGAVSEEVACEMA
ncbi:MAG: nicotinamide-nucleotide amidohydrolase family protein, partial [Thermoplasmata archaeon]